MRLRDVIVSALFGSAVALGGCVDDGEDDPRGEGWGVGEPLDNSASNNSASNNSTTATVPVRNNSTANNNSTNTNNTSTNTNNTSTSTNNTTNTTPPPLPACDNVTPIDVLPRDGWPDSTNNGESIPEEGTYLVCGPPSTGTGACLPGENFSPEQAREFVWNSIGRSFDNTDFCGGSIRPGETLCGAVESNELPNACCYAVELNFEYFCEGRPFIVDGMSRSAEVAEREGWREEIALDPSHLSPALRELIAASWADAGCHEHASIASFSRYLMQLLALGAPRQLVADATQAIDDEIRHAAACFSIASAYLGQPLGPTAIDVAGGMDGLDDLEDFLRATIIEGCIGESLAAFEAEMKLTWVQPPAIRQALQAIADEERDHAVLAWRTVQWILAEHPELATIVAETFAQQGLDPHDPWAVGITDEEQAALPHGYISGTSQERLRRLGYQRVVRPAIDALFASLGLTRATG